MSNKQNTTQTTQTTKVAKITDLLERKAGGKGKVLFSQEDLLAMFTKAGCRTKTDMIMTLFDAKHAKNDIAVTLQHYGVLTEKSAHQMVQNTIDRITSKRVRDQKSA